MNFLLYAFLFSIMGSYAASPATSSSFIDFYYKEMTYEEKTTGTLSDKIHWDIDYNPDAKIVTFNGKSIQNNTIAKYTPQMRLQQYLYQSLHDHSRKLQASFDGKKLCVSLNSPKSCHKKMYTLKRPWIQIFEFDLIPFVCSSEKELRFHILHPEDGALNDMVAKKVALEDLVVDHKHYKTQKITITLDHWLKSKFWTAEIWFDTQSLAMVQYKANRGPNSPISTLYLTSCKN
ncbi:MAG: hypothetical protein JW769_02785 [Parachlamydiales bacterium]|nr:hypothetical protein [Parachlamydiales bacterium]